MGFPQVDVAVDHPRRVLLLGSFLGGAAVFAALVIPATDNSLYHSIYTWE